MARGINVGKVRSKALEKGLITPEAAEEFTTDQAIEMLFQTGFLHRRKNI